MALHYWLALFFLVFTVACFAAAHLSTDRTTMQPRSFTVLSAVGEHATVVLYPQPFGKGIDRQGNNYRIVGDTAHLIEE